MTIETICDLCIKAVRGAGYNESTILNYKGVVRRFKKFCTDMDVIEYSIDVGKQYNDDVISKKTGSFSLNRYHTQGRFIRLINSYFNTGTFDFSVVKRGKISPTNQQHKTFYEKYQKFLHSIYDNKNTVHFYEYGMYCLLQFLDNLGIYDICDLQSHMIIRYIKETKQSRQREVLCELRGIFRYLEREDLLSAIAGIHAPRIKRIIPTLTDEENEKIESVIVDGRITLRDAAIVIIGLSCGIRACDLLNLRLSDIDWHNETLTFKQSKTGNLVCLPLTTPVGNSIAKYIIEERPDVKSDVLFLRALAPFTPLADHASCHAMVTRVFNKAGIKKGSRIYGMHMLRHNAASTMVKNEVPIETIAAILGHSSPDSTGVYITTDAKKLKECVLPMGNISKEVNP
jgi:integrase